MSNDRPTLGIEDIFTQSFAISLKTFRHLLPLYLALTGASAASSTMMEKTGNISLSAISVIIVAVAAGYLSIASTIVASQFWQGEPQESREVTLKQIHMTLIFEVIRLTLRVILTSIPLFLCLILPGLIYILNRSLAFYILVFARTTVSESLRESRRLMTAEPWYSIHGPQLRISGLLFVLMLFAMGIMFATMIFGAIAAVCANLFSSAMGQVFSSLILPVVAAAIQQFMTIFQIVVLIGFFLDLRNRYQINSLPE